MNKMKQLIFVIIGLMVAALVIGGTLMSVKSDIKNQVNNKSQSKTESISVSTNDHIKHDITFISITDTYINGNRSKGYILDKNGKKYDFNFSQKGTMTHEEVLEEAENLPKNTEGEFFTTPDDMAVIYDLCSTIDEKAGFDRKTDKNQTDTTSFYGVIYKDDKPVLVKIYSYGNINDVPHDPNAVSIKTFIMPRVPKE